MVRVKRAAEMMIGVRVGRLLGEAVAVHAGDDGVHAGDGGLQTHERDPLTRFNLHVVYTFARPPWSIYSLDRKLPIVYTLGMAARKRDEAEHQLHIKITRAQWERLQKLAASLGLTPSAYVRQHIATTTAK